MKCPLCGYEMKSHWARVGISPDLETVPGFRCTNYAGRCEFVGPVFSTEKLERGLSERTIESVRSEARKYYRIIDRHAR